MTAQVKKGTDLLYSLIAEARAYPDAIIMGRGDPDFDTPAHIVAAARAAMAAHGADHSPTEGLLALREAISARVRRYNQIEADPETEVVVTNGGQEALFLMVLAAVGEGQGLLVPEPNYNTYNDALRFARGVKIGVPTSMHENFRVRPEQVRSAITPVAKALLLASPNNPSAGVIGREDQQALVALAREHDLTIIADDIYDLFVYDDIKHTSTAAVPGGRERTMTLNALSKSFSMTGWRLGWVVGPAPLMARVRQLKAAISGPTAIISQHAAIAALTGPDEPVRMMHATYERRRQMVLDALTSMGIPHGAPQGGQFVFADIGFTGLSSIELAQHILSTEHVLVYPGAAFAEGWENFLRITFLQPEDKLHEGLERMKRAMASIPASR
jgi:aspartate/methionine/tyrosine aminotransferase